MRRNQRILCEMDRLGYLFPEYELCMRDGAPVLVGSGQFAAVYEMSAKTKGQPEYVCKVIGFGSESAPSARFREIVRMQRELYENSPYIVRILDAKDLLVLADAEGDLVRVENYTSGHGNDGMHLQFVLMEKLSDIIRQENGRPPVLLREELREEKEVLEFARQIGEVLRLAHEKNIIHRDVKLENIFWDPAEHRYKLGDFGIARYMEEGTAKTIAQTDGYGAPEIKNLGRNTYDRTVDIYSLGITMFLLLNDLKFPGSDRYRANQAQYNVNFAFPAPAHASEALAHVISKMCRYDSRARYQSMEEVLRALERVAEGRKKGKTADEKKPSRQAEEKPERKRDSDETETFRRVEEKTKPKRDADETETFRRAEKKTKPERDADETETFRRVEKKPERKRDADETETFRRVEEKPEAGENIGNGRTDAARGEISSGSAESRNGWTDIGTDTEYTESTDTENTDTENMGQNSPEVGIYLSRAERRRDERINRKKWKAASLRYFFLLTALLVPFLCGMQKYSDEMLRVEYVLLPVLLLMEAILLSLREFYLSLGAVCAIVFAYSVRTIGFTVPHAVLLLTALTATPAVMAAGAAATGLWLLLMISDTGGIVRYLQNHDVSWLFLICSLLALYGVLSAKIRTEQIERQRGLRRAAFFLSGLWFTALAGIVLTLLNEFAGVKIPELLSQLHPARTGILTALVICLIAENNGYAKEMDQALDDGIEQLEKESKALDDGIEQPEKEIDALDDGIEQMEKESDALTEEMDHIIKSGKRLKEDK